MVRAARGGGFATGYGSAGRACAEIDTEASGIISLIAAEKRVPVGLLLHPSRCRAGVAEARQLAMYLMHVILQRSLTEIGVFFGRDRTTVGYACACIEDRRDDLAFDAEVSRLEGMLEASAREFLEPAEVRHGWR